MSYVNPRSMSAIGVLLPVLAILSLGVRIYGWRHYGHGFGIDDVLVIPAGILTVAAGIALVIGTQMHIIGGHAEATDDPTDLAIESVKLGKFEYAFWIGHVLAIGFIKLTILFFFRRLFKGRTYRTAFDVANWTLVALVTLWTIVFLFFDIFACGTTPAASWESWNSLRDACIDTFGMQTGCAVFSWALDLAILIEPLVMIRRLNMSKRRKVHASLVFLCSGFAVIAGLLRMIPWIQVFIQDITNPTITLLNTTFSIVDQQGIISIALFWTYIEIGVGFIVACVPRSVWVLDKIPIDLILCRLRSFSSSVSLLRKDQRSHQTVQLKASSGHRSDDDAELAVVTGHASGGI